MFTLEDNLKFIYIDTKYVKKLHQACNEVFYKEINYDNKPYLGLLVNNENRKYVIPLTSAKEKHKTWANCSKDKFLIFEEVCQNQLSDKAIYTNIENSDKVKHVISAIDLKKMIPVKDSVINIIDINVNPVDTEEVKKYKNLLNKEYSFCVKIKDKIIENASKIYDYQINTGKIIKFCCDFKLLEKICDEYTN